MNFVHAPGGERKSRLPAVLVRRERLLRFVPSAALPHDAAAFTRKEHSEPVWPPAPMSTPLRGQALLYIGDRPTPTTFSFATTVGTVGHGHSSNRGVAMTFSVAD